ncbi:transcription factor iws1 protein [Apiospora arundinis]
MRQEPRAGRSDKDNDNDDDDDDDDGGGGGVAGGRELYQQHNHCTVTFCRATNSRPILRCQGPNFFREPAKGFILATRNFASLFIRLYLSAIQTAVMSDVEDSNAAAAPETLHEEDRDDQQEKELGDYDVEDAGDSDKESDALSDVDEDQFDEYDPGAAQIEEKPVEIDEDVARTLKAGKRKGQAVRKPKEGRREKKRSRQDDNDGADGEIQTGKRQRAGPSAAASRSERASPEPVPEENLTPEERRKRAIERAAAKDIKKPSQRRRKKDEIDLENDLAERIDMLSQTMAKACEADNAARLANQPANNKLRVLPEVMSLLNSNNQQDAIVDPDHNFLRAVTWFLEPLQDGSLPAYTIQRDIFNALLRLPIEKDSLKASGLGKVVLFYTKSKKPEIGIKRIAERLLGDWSRPILNRTDDYKKRHIETRDFDYQAAKLRQSAGAQFTLSQRSGPPATQLTRREIEREKILAQPDKGGNRARVTGLPSSYSVAPKSTFTTSSQQGPEYRPIGATGDAAFRKMVQKNKAKKK